MEARILNVYNNDVLPGRGLKGSHGESFLIAVGDRKILLDTGWKPRVFLHNLAKLGMDPNGIDQLVLSHGHRDHTGGLTAFLQSRTSSTPLPIIAHPEVREPKAIKAAGLYIPMGLPKLAPELEATVQFQLSKEAVEVLPGLFTTGEIPLAERMEKPGAEPRAYHKVKGQWEGDPIIDDLSVVLKTDKGLVIITGCCHAGLLNTCAKATRTFGDKIHAVIGGTHMMRYSEEEVEHVGTELKKDYGSPELYLNHCTGKKAIAQLKKRLGPEIVHDCFVGSEIIFNMLP